VFRLTRARPAAPEPLPRRRAADAAASSERRVREAVALVGEALAASHDPEALLPVILESAIGATGAAGARLVSDGREIVRAGDPDGAGAPLALRLGSEEEPAGLMLLYPPAGTSFDAQAGDLAAWLAGQASIALENARLHRAVKRQAVTDELTDLANRRRFSETLKLEVRRAERFGHPLALVLADLDDFKLVNDRFGHQAGDEVLRRFAAVMRECVRDVDLAARYGGEEFALLLPDTGLEGAGRLAERLAESFNGLVLRDPVHGDLRVTASFGVAAYPEATTSDELLAAADRALYAAKAAGKNRVVAG
jgi:diguanylate cyclase (GGDEF)-like protein